MKNKKEEIKILLKKLRDSISKRPFPFTGMDEEKVIKHLREIRKGLWEKKGFSHSI